MCTINSHHITQNGNCLCGAFQDHVYCPKRDFLKNTLPQMGIFGKDSLIPDQPCCGHPEDCRQ